MRTGFGTSAKHEAVPSIEDQKATHNSTGMTILLCGLAAIV
jgi:hypothetical protein